MTLASGKDNESLGSGEKVRSLGESRERQGLGVVERMLEAWKNRGKVRG